MPHRDLLIGLIGAGIEKSRSPAQHQGAAADAGLVCIYRLIDLDRLGLGPDSLPELLQAAARMGFAGVNITYPCKQSVIPLLDDLSSHARALGAVNTVVFADGRRVGHNTDWFGYAESLKHDLPGADLGEVVLFGAGGAGAAVAYALLHCGAGKVVLSDTDSKRASQLTERMARIYGAGRVAITDDPQSAVFRATGIVNATPIGMAKFPGTPFPVDWLRPNHWVSDVVYFPLETKLLREARMRGCRTLDGSGMNVRQAAEAFRLFTGITPNVERMYRYFVQAGDPS